MCTPKDVVELTFISDHFWQAEYKGKQFSLVKHGHRWLATYVHGEHPGYAFSEVKEDAILELYRITHS